MSGSEGVEPGRPLRHGGWILGGGAACAVLALGGLALVVRSSDDPDVVPSPLFDDVEQLTPTELPEGWARCGGAPSDRPDASDRWWAQTFGPARDGDCTPLITVTQVPGDERVRWPRGATNGGIGEEPGRTGAKLWSDPDTGSRGLYTTVSGGTQRLVVEGCCGAEATGDSFHLVANAARDGTRERAPDRCTKPHSDLEQEQFLTNFFAQRERVHDEERCPVRADIVSWHTEPVNAHCWQGMTFLTLGTPAGEPMTDDTRRLYTRDPLGVRESTQKPDLGQDLDTDLPSTAVDTGYRQAGSSLWIDPADDRLVYVVDGDRVEAWPLDDEQYACA